MTDSASNGLSDLHHLFAGVGLLAYSGVGLSMYIVVARTMRKLAVTMPGFRVLLSDSIANMGQIIIFGLWNAILILLQKDPLPVQSRVVVAFLNNWIWFSMSTHYSLVAFTRFAALCRPFWFLVKFKKYAFYSCIAIWVVTAIQAVYLQSRDWWYIFYYDPTQYGMVMDNFTLYMINGQADFWSNYNMIVVMGPLVFYIPAVLYAVKNRALVNNEASQDQQRQMSVEKRILLPCAINQGIYFMEAYLFQPFYGKIMGWFDEGKWALLILYLIFVTNSLVNPFLLFSLSSEVRRGVLGRGDASRTSKSNRSTRAKKKQSQTKASKP